MSRLARCNVHRGPGLVGYGCRSLILAVAIFMALHGATASANMAVEPCSRSALTPERMVYNDDALPDEIHAAAGAMYCPNDVWVQITACVQRQTESGWVDVGCATSRRTRITVSTPGGRGQAVSFELPCVSGVLRTHVTGGEGLEPTQWDSDTATIACFTEGPPPPPPPPPPVDATPPDTTISSGPAALSDVASAAFTFDSEPGAAFECRLDSAAFEPCATPAIVTALADGDHTFAVRAIDAAGNVDPSEATWAFTVDTAPPETTITAGPADTIRQRTVTFTFASAEAGASFECHLDGAAWEACASPFTYMSLRDGEHVFGARATDAAGNVGPDAARTFRVRRRGGTPTGSLAGAVVGSTTHAPHPRAVQHAGEADGTVS